MNTQIHHYCKNLTKKNRRSLEYLYKKLKHNTKYYAGYPPNTVFDYSELYRVLKFSVNNLGDPFYGKNALSSHNIECEVLNFFASLFHAPKEFSGYITNGGTEGNLYSLYLARKKYPKAITYFSAHTHYSIPKNIDILNMPYKIIPTTNNGEINYDFLEHELTKNNKNPAIIVANIGTTVVSAIDNINKIKNALKKAKITDYFLHADAAFDGMILPFVKNPPPFRFSDGIDSITISGHKLIGAPIPCGIVLTKKIHVASIGKIIAYVKKPDTTISGSRNGITPLFLWYAINRIGKNGFKLLINEGFKKANYALKVFNRNGIKAWKNKYALTVIFPALSSQLLKKWNIPTGYGFSQITALPKLSYKMIDELCKDIVAESNKKFQLQKNKKLIF